jgi:hypothetical protein
MKVIEILNELEDAGAKLIKNSRITKEALEFISQDL